MAAIHNQLTRGPWGNALKNALGDTKSSGQLERFGETLTPTINLWEEIEWSFLRGELLFQVTTTVGAIVAEFGTVALVNPAGSSLLVRAEDVVFGSTAAAVVAVLSVVTQAAAEATLGGVAVGVSRDRRNLNTSRCSVRAGTDPAGVGAAMERASSAAAAGFSFFRGLPVVLPPGQALVVQSGTVNQVFEASFKWRERHAMNGELFT